MIKPKNLLAIVLPALLVIGGIGFYYSASHSVAEKPVVKLPTKYVGDVYIFPFNIEYTYGNETPLAKYWEKEFYKGRVWTISKDNITLTIRPINGECQGSREYQSYFFSVVLNSSRYIEKVKFISDARYIEKLGNCASVLISPGPEDRKYIEKDLGTSSGDYELMILKLQKNNVSIHINNYLHIDERRVNDTLPYNFTVYIETKDKIYRMEFDFNLTDEWGPYLDLWLLYHKNNFSYYIPGATYFCYNSSWGKVVISDHLVAGTQYYFIEKNGILSEIWSPYEVRNGRLG